MAYKIIALSQEDYAELNLLKTNLAAAKQKYYSLDAKYVDLKKVLLHKYRIPGWRISAFDDAEQYIVMDDDNNEYW